MHDQNIVEDEINNMSAFNYNKSIECSLSKVLKETMFIVWDEWTMQIKVGPKYLVVHFEIVEVTDVR